MYKAFGIIHLTEREFAALTGKDYTTQVERRDAPSTDGTYKTAYAEEKRRRIQIEREMDDLLFQLGQVMHQLHQERKHHHARRDESLQ